MAPKKQQSKAQAPPSGSVTARGVAQVRLSANAEKRLTELVGNVGKYSDSGGDGELMEGQKKQAEKRLRKIYDSLADEGFTVEQIELALAAIPLSKITLETALDWLCLNLHPNALPLKFSSGFSVEDKGGNVQILASSQPETATRKPSEKADLEKEFVNYVKIDQKKSRQSQDTDKDWIRQYVAQQEEEEEIDPESSGDSDWEERAESSMWLQRPPGRKATDPAERVKQIASEFSSAKQAAIDAKGRGDKQRQTEASNLIRKLKDEMLFLGLTEQDVLSGFEASHTVTKFTEQHDSDSTEFEHHEPLPDATFGEHKTSPEAADVDTMNANIDPTGSKTDTVERVTDEDDEGLMGIFDDESSQNQSLPTTVRQLQKKEELVAWGTEATSKSGSKKNAKPKAYEEAQKPPRAVLQQYCLKNGWDAPKYEKLAGKTGEYRYAVTILRPAIGRGKNKKAGGPVTFSLPEHEDSFHSISDAQDAVGTWAIFSLFPELPLYRVLREPFRSMWLRWHDQGEAAKDQEGESKDSFIRSLLDSGNSNEVHTVSKTSETVANAASALETDKTAHKSVALNHDRFTISNQAANSHLKFMQERKLKDETYQKMLRARSLLPIAAVRETLLDKLSENNVVVVSGETGSGKTTQVPQYILDDMIMAGHGGFCKIICTQPRRIAAISVAERVAVERCEPAPGSTGSLVGYQVRLDASWSSETRLLFCTTGILLRRLASDRLLSDVSHIVVDEVHERTVLGDFLMSLLKDILTERNESDSNPLKLILMSATLDAERFSQYFGGCPVIIAEGRTFSVTSYYLEDIYEQLSYRLSSDNPAAVQNSATHNKKSSRHLIGNSRGRQNLALSGWGDEKVLEEVVVNPLYDESLYHSYSERTRSNLAKVNEDVIDYELLENLILYVNETREAGALLVFLPGMPEIQQLMDRLSALKTFAGAALDWLLPLHSSVAPADQRRVFKLPPKGIRKIVLATNIAETSVTIEDVVHVIDCGKHKENRFDPRRRMSRMVEAWISQANASQRRGRAGRVQAGNCFCLYTWNRFEKLMRPFQLPEILRVPLVELCLQIKLLSVENVASFLEKALDPPKVEAVESALSILREVGALSEEEELTPLGYHLAALPVDVHIGKMMLYGVLLGCLSPVLTIAAYLSHKSPFIAPIGQRDAAERAKHAFAGEGGETITSNNVATKQQSDHLVIVAAYNGWRRIMAQGGAKATRQFCDSNFLSVPVLNMLREMRIQFAKLLRDIGFITQEEGATRDADRWLDDVNQPFNKNAHCAPVIKSVLCAGLYPNVAAMMEDSIKAGHANALNQRAGLASEKKPHWIDGRREVYIHPSSINSNVLEFQHPYLVFHEKVETSRVYLRDTTVLSPFSLLLFGGAIKVQHQIGHVTVDGWMKMNVPARTAVLCRELRLSLDSILDELTKSPQEGHSSKKAKEVISSVLELLIDVEQPQL